LLKKVQSKALLIGAFVSESLVVFCFIQQPKAYLWLNPLGCLVVMILSFLLQPLFKKKEV